MQELKLEYNKKISPPYSNLQKDNMDLYQETKHTQPKSFDDEGTRVDGQIPILSSINASEEIRYRLIYDNSFNDDDIEKENNVAGRAFVRGISLDITRMEQFVQHAKELMQNINQGGELVFNGKNIHLWKYCYIEEREVPINRQNCSGGAVNGPKKIHLGFRIYQIHDFYKGDGLFSLRQYHFIDGKVPSNRGVSMRHGNFSKLLQVIKNS